MKTIKSAMKNAMLNARAAAAANSEGQGLAEYGLILAGVAVGAVAAVKLLGNKVSGIFGNVNDGLDTVIGNAA